MLKSLRSLVFVSLFAVGAVGLSACGGNACDDAADKFADCMGASGQTSGTSGGGECSGQIECAAECTNAASCDDIKSSTTLQAPSYASNPLVKCIAACK